MLRLICKGSMKTRVPQLAKTFNGATPTATDNLLVNGVPKFPNRDPDIRDLLLRAVRTDREQRPILQNRFVLTESSPNTLALDGLTIRQLLYDAYYSDEESCFKYLYRYEYIRVDILRVDQSRDLVAIPLGSYSVWTSFLLLLGFISWSVCS
ncbi:hypothetical protein GGR51DRAFT_338853 [Nemania sp. FL0031]|nr:hypothetical protein GGR51DRAFT_338853 [Nemania sp. FL0031]